MAKANNGRRSSGFTPEGVLTKVTLSDYIEFLDPDGAFGLRDQLMAAKVDLDGVTAMRIEVKRRMDNRAWQRGVSLFPPGQVIDLVNARISGAESQIVLGESLPGQERMGVLRALLNGAKYLLVTVETASAKPRSIRPVYSARIDLIQEGRVLCWWASSLDRVTRWAIDGCRLVEALQDTGTLLRAGGTTHEVVDPQKGLMLIINFAMNSMTVIMISSGLRRVWHDRLSKGQWLRARPLLGMDLDRKCKPSYNAESRAVVHRAFELVAEGHKPKVAAEMILAEFPLWVEARKAKESRGGRAFVTAARIERMILTSALTDGKTTWGFREETREVFYPELVGIIPEVLRVRARTALFARPTRKYNRVSPWNRMFIEFLEAHGHPMHTIVELSAGALEWDSRGTFAFKCKVCKADAKSDDEQTGVVPSVMIETTPDQEDIRLVDGTVRKNVPIPRFECSACEKKTPLFSKNALGWLLAGHRPPSCALCPNPWVHVERVGKSLTFVGQCRDCDFEFAIPAERLPVGIRAGNFTVARPRRTKLPPADQSDLADFDNTEGEST